MRINQNISAMNTHASMVKSDNGISKSLERLSSGLRINRAADDAAGLAISEKMRGQIRGLQQASRNAQDGISLLQTAEGALNETHSILQRMRELSVQAANDTLTSSDRGEIQKEMDQLTKEIDRISGSTEFNTKSLLRGTTGVALSGANMAGGANATQAVWTTGAISGNLNDGDSITFGGVTITFAMAQGADGVANVTGNSATVNLTAADASAWDDTAGAQLQAALTAVAAVGGSPIEGITAAYDNGTNTLTLTDTLAHGDNNNALAIPNATGLTLGGAARSTAGVDAATASGSLTVSRNLVAGESVTIGANTLTAGTDFVVGADTATTVSNLMTAIDNLGTVNASLYGGSNNRIDITAALAGAAGNYALSTTAGATASQTLTMHIGANAGQSVAITISNTDAGTLGIGRDSLGNATAAGTDAYQGLNVTTQAAANAAITTIDAALTTVSSERSKLGAYQNRLEHTISNLGAAAENLSSSESRVRDVDMAQEMANFSRSQILMQASTAMMAQANQKPQAVLKLLG